MYPDALLTITLVSQKSKALVLFLIDRKRSGISKKSMARKLCNRCFLLSFCQMYSYIDTIWVWWMSFYYFTSLSPPFPMDNACVQISLFLIMFHISSFPPYLESHKRKPSKSANARVVKNWVNKYQVLEGWNLIEMENSLTLYLNIRRTEGAEEHLLLFWEKEIKLLPGL